MNYDEMGFVIQSSARKFPATGELLLFDREKTKQFKQDGVNWARRKGQTRVQETYQIIKIKGEIRIHGVYCRSGDDPKFQKRIYRLADGSSSLVLVHYRHCSLSEDIPDAFHRDTQEDNSIKDAFAYFGDDPNEVSQVHPR